MDISYARVFRQQIAKDLKQYGRNLGQAITPLLFFAVVVALFPLSMRPEPELLAKIAPGMVWVAALLATLLSLQSLFQRDFEDGSLHLMILSEVPLWFQVMAKQLAHWLVCGLPLVLLAPIAAYSLNLGTEAYPVLLIALLLGTLVLSAFGTVGAALTVSIGQGGLLFSVLVLPLIVPALILGSQATALAQTPGPDGGISTLAIGALYMLAGICVLAVTLAPFAASSALRINMD